MTYLTSVKNALRLIDKKKKNNKCVKQHHRDLHKSYRQKKFFFVIHRAWTGNELGKLLKTLTLDGHVTKSNMTIYLTDKFFFRRYMYIFLLWDPLAFFWRWRSRFSGICFIFLPFYAMRMFGRFSYSVDIPRTQTILYVWLWIIILLNWQ